MTMLSLPELGIKGEIILPTSTDPNPIMGLGEGFQGRVQGLKAGTEARTTCLLIPLLPSFKKKGGVAKVRKRGGGAQAELGRKGAFPSGSWGTSQNVICPALSGPWSPFLIDFSPFFCGKMKMEPGKPSLEKDQNYLCSASSAEL
jgi:hypothetical protein